MKYFYLFLVCISAVTALFPKEIPKCHYGDVNCIVKSANFVVKNYKTLKGLNLTNVDPLKVSAIDVTQKEGQIDLKMGFKNAAFYNTSKTVFTKFVGFTKDIAGDKYEMYFTNPKIVAKGDYKIDGKVMTMPIQGDGKFTLEMDNLSGLYRFVPKKVKINGKDHLQIEKYKFFTNITKLSVNLENLFNGDKDLGLTTNQFLNENWELLFDQVKAPIFKQIGSFLKDVMNNIFSSAPYADMFLP